MTTLTVADTIATFLAGPYDAATRLYHSSTPGTPVVAGLYSLKRARPKQWDGAEYDYGMQPGVTQIGCTGIVLVEGGTESRIAVAGATSGVKMVRHDVQIDFMLRGTSAHAEDVEDAQRALWDAVVARIRSDRTCGSGGFEVGGFQIAETDPWLRHTFSSVTTSNNVSKAAMILTTEAHELVQA